MYVVAGVSGNTGSVVASTLLERGKRVRVLVRDRTKGERWAAQGAEVAVADLGDTAALAQAFASASGAYVLLPPRYTSSAPLAENAQLADSIVAAAKIARLGHVVVLSSRGAQIPQGTGLIEAAYDMETKLFPSGIPATTVRAASFYENHLPALGAAKGAGIFPTFFRKDLAVASVAAKDVGRVAAQALIDGPRGNQIIELSGPRDLTATDIAAALGRVLGKELTVQEIPDAAVVATMTSHGASSDVAEQFRAMVHSVNDGTLRFEGGTARQIRGEVTIEEWFRAVAP